MAWKFGLERVVSSIVNEKWNSENKEFILGFPDKIPPTQPGDFPGSSLDYDADFPSKVVPLILRVARNKKEAKLIIEGVFSKIERGTYPNLVEDGDHHSITYGEPTFHRYYINSYNALSLAQQPDELRKFLVR